MKLKDIIKDIEYKWVKGSCEIEIKGICYDSRNCREGYLFICIEGAVTDGHKYIKEAAENGAAAVAVQKEISVPYETAVFLVGNTRRFLAHASCEFYNNPSKHIHLAGVTGTKGKTTISYMVKSIFDAAKINIGLMGTISNYIGEEQFKTSNTTNESTVIQHYLDKMVKRDISFCIMEVSSQALMLDRAYGCDFDTAVFSNISRAHIGLKEHKSFEQYLESKAKLFTMCKRALINNDSDYAGYIKGIVKGKVYTFGIDNKADIMAYDIEKRADSVVFMVKTPWFTEKINLSMPGTYNVYNALAAVGISCFAGISKDKVKNGLKDVNVKGRTERIKTNRNFKLMIDYAHSPGSLMHVLKEIKPFSKGRVVCLFGCGGDRDRAMRPMMGEISGKMADFTIITSDNPRTEEPIKIINDIEEGIKKTKGEYIIIPDRTKAIRYAIEHARKDDIIILAGKGHETYLDINNKKYPYDEREIAAKILCELKDGGHI